MHLYSLGKGFRNLSVYSHVSGLLTYMHICTQQAPMKSDSQILTQVYIVYVCIHCCEARASPLAVA